MWACECRNKWKWLHLGLWNYVCAITGYHIAQFFPESEPQLEGPLDSPDFTKNKNQNLSIILEVLMIVILHPEPVPLLIVQRPHQSPTLMLASSFSSLVLATMF